MEQFLMKPKVDFAFKEIMTDEKARIGFLAAVLKINPEDIKETQILNTNLRREYEDDKHQYIESAYERLQLISQDREKRLEYEAREKAILDHNQMMLEAEERGREQGWKQGQEQGEDRIIRLNTFLLNEKRYDDLERATRDKDFRRQLMDQYGI